jgi:hypothetical protein
MYASKPTSRQRPLTGACVRPSSGRGAGGGGQGGDSRGQELRSRQRHCQMFQPSGGRSAVGQPLAGAGSSAPPTPHGLVRHWHACCEALPGPRPFMYTGCTPANGGPPKPDLQRLCHKTWPLPSAEGPARLLCLHSAQWTPPLLDLEHGHTLHCLLVVKCGGATVCCDGTRVQCRQPGIFAPCSVRNLVIMMLARVQASEMVPQLVYWLMPRPVGRGLLECWLFDAYGPAARLRARSRGRSVPAQVGRQAAYNSCPVTALQPTT